jgi:hypothetical protein
MFERSPSRYVFSPFEIVENYNENHLKKFMKHALCSRMFYFVFANYLHYYYPLIKGEYRDQVMTMICCILNCYRKMKRSDHIERVDFWIY